VNTALLLVFLFQTQQTVDLLKVAGKPRGEVEAVVGKPTHIEYYTPKGLTNCQCEKVFYLEDNISIVYYQGKADWITAQSKIKLLNIDVAKIKFYGNWRKYVQIKTLTMEEKECCSSNI